MTYDPAEYWTERGRTYAQEFQHDNYIFQERMLNAILSGLDFDAVLEVGCGFGRIARLVKTVHPTCEYTGIDISPTMLASRWNVDGEYVETSLQDYEPGRRFDLVLAVEVLMHVPPEDVREAVSRLGALSSRYVVTCDWDVPPDEVVDPPAGHNFLHDYDSLMGKAARLVEVGSQVIRVMEFW